MEDMIKNCKNIHDSYKSRLIRDVATKMINMDHRKEKYDAMTVFFEVHDQRRSGNRQSKVVARCGVPVEELDRECVHFNRHLQNEDKGVITSLVKKRKNVDYDTEDEKNAKVVKMEEDYVEEDEDEDEDEIEDDLCTNVDDTLTTHVVGRFSENPVCEITKEEEERFGKQCDY